MKDNTDEQIKNIVRELFENIFAGADDYGNPAINANLSFEEIEEQLTQSLQKYGEKVREKMKEEIIQELFNQERVSQEEYEDDYITCEWDIDGITQILISLTKQEKGQR